MADMAELLSLANRLGDAIAAHPRVKAFVQAQAAVEKSDEAKKLLNTFEFAAARIHELEQQGQPIEPEDKRRMRDSEQALSRSAELQALMRAQADYIELMNEINTAMSAPVARAQQAASGS